MDTESKVIIYDVNSFPYCIINRYPILKSGNGMRCKTKIDYLDCVCAFDIETTRLDDYRSIMYIWQFQLDEYTVVGRTWDEYKTFISKISDYLKDTHLVVYVHNLSFEFQFLSGIFWFQSSDVFCIKSRKILKAVCGNIEYRCSYLLTNKSLDKFLKDEGVDNLKVGGFDYSKKRYWFTTISEDEMEYCINDVKGLVQAIKSRLVRDNDTLRTIPLTSTGYIRRLARKSLAGYNRSIPKMFPDTKTYLMLNEAFRGGDTHASRFFADKIVHEVKSYDKSSSYPDSLVNKKYPMSKFVKPDKCGNEEDLKHLIFTRGKAVVFRAEFTNVYLRGDFGSPYIPLSKTRKCRGGVIDNGRLLSADSFEMTCTDIDYKIIKYQYKFNLKIIECRIANYAYLPQGFRYLIIRLYKDKTKLKGDMDKLYDYNRFKELINACYGMTAQNPCKENILYNPEENDYEREFEYYDKTESEIFMHVGELLNNYYKSAFLPYQWGVWCTAHSRYELFEAVKNVENTEGAFFVYCDTDSVKYIETGNTVDFTCLNKNREELSRKSEAVGIDINGEEHILGVFEYEGKYKRFKTLGAKKYCVEYENSDVEIAVAGVPKKKGSEELKQLGGIEEFNIGVVFRAGKLETVYCDNINEHETIDGHDVHITKCVTLRPTTYELSITDDYREVIENADLFKKAFDIM